MIYLPHFADCLWVVCVSVFCWFVCVAKLMANAFDIRTWPRLRMPVHDTVSVSNSAKYEIEIVVKNK